MDGQNLPNIQWYQHAFVMIPYLLIGEKVKTKMDYINRNLSRIVLCGVIVIFIQWVLHTLKIFSMPAQDLSMHIGFKAPIHLINVLLGTSITYYLARKLQNSKFLQIIGRGSLVCYLLNEAVQVPVIYALKPFYNCENPLVYIPFHVISYVLCVCVLFLLIRVLYSTKYMSWLVGKW